MSAGDTTPLMDEDDANDLDLLAAPGSGSPMQYVSDLDLETLLGLEEVVLPAHTAIESTQNAAAVVGEKRVLLPTPEGPRLPAAGYAALSHPMYTDEAAERKFYKNQKRHIRRLRKKAIKNSGNADSTPLTIDLRCERCRRCECTNNVQPKTKAHRGDSTQPGE